MFSATNHLTLKSVKTNVDGIVTARARNEAVTTDAVRPVADLEVQAWAIKNDVNTE